MENWPTYYPAEMTGEEIREDMLEHEEKQYAVILMTGSAGFASPV